MALDIKKYTVLTRLYKRFNVETSGTIELPRPIMLPVVFPVTQVDELLRSRRIESKSQAVAGNNWYTLFTVPVNKRWYVRSVCLGLTSGTFTIQGLAVGDGTTTTYIKWYTTPVSTQDAFQPGGILPLDQGWTVETKIVGFSAGGSMFCDLIIEEEDAY